MSKVKSRHTLRNRMYLVASVCAVTIFALLPGRAAAEDFLADEVTAALYGDDVTPPITTFGRSARTLSEVAENVTVITKEDIARLQAHTIDDVFQYYPGIMPYPSRMSSDLSVPMLQGLPNRQTLVTLDGIPLNNLSDGVIDIGVVPVGFLERIEIVKGPAASVWGRSVGAVINLVTQEPEKNRLVSGRFTGSLGTNQTGYGDLNLSGSNQGTGTGYFLAATGRETSGFQKGIDGQGRAIYAKLTQPIGSATDLSVLFARAATERNFLNLPQQNVRAVNGGAAYFGIARLQHRLSPTSDIDASLYFYNLSVDNSFYNLGPIPPFIPVPGIKVQSQGTREETEGLQFAYKKNTSRYWLTIGVDATMSSLRNSEFSLAPPPKNNRSVTLPDNVAEYVTGGFNLSRDLTLTASFRYDWYSRLDATYSPNLGVIYKLDDKSVLRATYGYGYSLPTVNSGSPVFETLWRAQAGIETNHIPGVWFKANAFYDRTHNVKLQLKFFDQGAETNKNLTREGLEIEARSIPLLNTSFGLGYSYAHIFNSDSGSDIAGLPRHHLLLDAHYRAHGTDALLVARYVNWNNTQATDSLIWDFLLTQKIATWDTGDISLQVSIRNLFNGSQRSTPTFPNPPLRADGGIKVVF